MRWRATACLMAAALLIEGRVFAQAEAPPAEESQFSREQIEQMVAPIALYPDALVAQVLMGSTYPLEVVQATRWLKKNPGLEGSALDQALAEQTWDPSVKTLVLFPSVLQRMSDNLEWTQDLGDAFLAQEGEVLDAIQRLRKLAYDHGSLTTTKQQTVVAEGDTINIAPSKPEVVYVPSYEPAQAYGTGYAPTTTYYPAVYTAPPPTATTAVESTSTVPSWVTFGAGALVGGLLTAAIDWDDDDDWHGVYYGGSRYWDDDWRGPRYGDADWGEWSRNARNVNVQTGDITVDRSRNIDRDRVTKWEHNSEHRGGVRYRDSSTQQRFAQTGARAERVDWDAARGFDRTRPAQQATADSDRPWDPGRIASARSLRDAHLRTA